MLPIRPCRIESAMGPLADEGLLLRDDPANAQVLWRDRSIGLLAADDVALLRAEHVHGFGTVGRDPKGLAGRHHGFPKRQAIPAGCPELVGQLARERDPVKAHGNASRLALAN